MSGPQIILWVIALAVMALCLHRGVPQAKRAVAETNRGFWRILPMFCVALPMAAWRCAWRRPFSCPCWRD